MSLPHRIPSSARVTVRSRDWDTRRHTPTLMHERIAPPTRQRDSWAVRYQYVLTAAIVFIVAFIAGGLL